MSRSITCPAEPIPMAFSHRFAVVANALLRTGSIFFASVWRKPGEFQQRRAQARQVSELSLHVLRDINAQDWTHGRAIERKENERYERARAMSPTGRFL